MTKGHREALEVMDMLIIQRLGWCLPGCIFMSKLIKSCTLNMCSLLHVNDTLINLFFKVISGPWILFQSHDSLFTQKVIIIFIQPFIFGCAGSWWLHQLTLQLQWANLCGGFSYCGAQTLRYGLQQLWYTGLVASQHMGSSRIRDQTPVCCIGRQILYH